MARHLLRPALAALVLIGGCTQGAKDPGPLTFADVPPIRLGVHGITVEEPQPGAVPAGNFIDRQRTEILLQATRDYLQTALQATGGADWGKAVIEEAVLVERPRELRGGITGALTREPARDLVGILAVRVAAVDGLGIEKAYARARVEMKRSVLEGTKVIARDQLARSLIKDMLDQMNTLLRSSIEENLSGYAS